MRQALRHFRAPQTEERSPLVDYEPPHSPPALADFLALRTALEELFSRKVDLAMATAIRNPYLRAGIDAARVPLHGA